MLQFGFSKKTIVLLYLFVNLLSLTSALAANDAPQTFTLDGQLFQSGTTHTLLDSSVKIDVQIIDPSGKCVLYEEAQTVNTLATDGYFHINVGSNTGSAKRAVNDPGRTMAQVFQNISAIPANSVSGQTCVGSSYTPTAGAVRYFRLTVTPSSTNVSDILSPDIVIDSVPQAMVAQSVQGLERFNILQVNTTAPVSLNQANLEALFTSPAYGNLQTILNGNFMKSDAAGAALPGFATDPATAAIGDVWYDTTTNQVKYLSNSGVQTVGASGGGAISSLTVGSSMSLNGSVAGTISNGSGTIDLTNTGVANGTYTKVTVDTKGRVTAGTVSLVEADIPNLTVAGKVSGNTITSGTISGSAGVNTTGNLITTGTVSGLNVQATNLRVYNGANYVQMTAGTISSNLNFTLPTNLGTNGQILATDGSGAMSWTSLSASSFTGTMTVAKGGTGSSSFAANAVIVSNGTGSALQALNCTSGQVVSFDASGYAVCGTAGTISGSGTVGKHAKFTAAGMVGDSLISETGTAISFNGSLEFPTTTATVGQINVNGSRFLHNYNLNTFVGAVAGNYTHTGLNNSGLGRATLQSLTSGADNTAVGYRVGRAITTGASNTGVGSNVFQLMTTGSDNTAVGVQALQATTSGVNNTGLGVEALYNNSTGIENVGVGYSALWDNTTGNNNTALGNYAGQTSTIANTNVTGSNNTFIGFDSGPGTPTQLNNATTLGAGARVTASNSLVLGAAGVNVGIGVTAPSTALEVNGAINQDGIAAPAVSPSGQGRIYFDSTSKTFKVSQDGSAYGDLVVSGGGGGSFVSKTGDNMTGNLSVAAGTAVGISVVAAPSSATAGALYVSSNSAVGNAIYANETSGGTAIYAKGSTGIAIDATSGNSGATVRVTNTGLGTGILGLAKSGSAGYFQSTNASNANATVLIARYDNTSNANLLEIQDEASTKLAWIDSNGLYHGNGSALTGVTASNISGTLSVAHGGTGTTSYGNSHIIMSNASGSALVDVTCSLNQVLSFNTVGSAVCSNVSSLFPSAIINGGNTTGADISIGTNDNKALAFKVNDATAMTISQGGNVGIGTTAPLGRLTIVGVGTSSSDTLKLTDSAANVIFNVQDSGTIGLGSGGVNNITMAPTINVNGGGSRTLRFSNNTAASTEGFQFYNSTASSSLLMIQQSGNIGIGTTLPSSALDVSGAITAEGMSSAPAVSNAGTGRIFYDYSTNKFRISQNGSAYVDLVGAGSITSVGGQTGAAQSLAISVDNSVATPTITSASNTHTWKIPMASNTGTTAGLLSKTDYDAFNTKLGTATSFAGDVSGTYNSTIVQKIQGKSVTAGSVSGQMMIYDGTQWVNSVMSGDATLNYAGALTLNKVPVTKGGTNTTSYGNNHVIVSNGTGSALVDVTCSLNQVLSFDASGYVVCSNVSSIFAAAIVNGGNTTGADISLGTNDNKALAFKVNNATAMTISQNGYVGIGTTAPAAALDIVGQTRTVASTGGAKNNTGSTTIDWNNGNIQYTTDSCQAYTMNNLLDAGTYIFTVKGATSAQCTFTATGLTFHYTPSNAPTNASTHTIYSLFRAGSDVYVSWTTGL